jgi:hypothetical protein
LLAIALAAGSLVGTSVATHAPRFRVAQEEGQQKREEKAQERSGKARSRKTSGSDGKAAG